MTKIEKDQNSTLLANATYDLYKDNQVIKSGLKTDSNGELMISDLENGNYSLKETSAPSGYELDSTPVEFTINNTDSVSISGGTTSVIDDKNVTHTANANVQTFISGHLNDDIILTKTGNSDVSEVKVKYLRIKTSDTDVEDNKEYTYSSLDEAVIAINKVKNAGNIYGSVSVEVVLKSALGDEVKISHENAN